MNTGKSSPVLPCSARVALIGAVAFALTPLFSGPILVVPGVLCLILPGASVLGVLASDEVKDGVVFAFVAVALSVAVDALLGVGLYALGIPITKDAVAISLAVLVAICAVTIVLRTPSALSLNGEEEEGNEPKVLNWRTQIGRVVIILLGGSSLVVGVVLVHGQARTSSNGGYLWLTQSGDPTLVVRHPGPMLVRLAIHSSYSTYSHANLKETLDGVTIEGPRLVTLRASGITVTSVDGYIPALNGCIHRIEIVLSEPQDPGLSVTRYLTGEGRKC